MKIDGALLEIIGVFGVKADGGSLPYFVASM
jgi:hypothetical protein